jgi:hypothetical protein
MNKLLISTLLSVGLGAAAPLVVAQNAAPGAGAPQVRQAQPHEKRAFALPSERVEARLAYLKTALKITDAQRTQWDNFANVQRTHAKSMDQRFQARRAQMDKGGQAKRFNAIERMELRQQRMTSSSQRLTELIAVAKPLYASFSPEQRQIADEVLARGRGGKGGHGGRGHHRGGPHGGMQRGA